MNSTKKYKIIYWILTVLFLLPTAGPGILELFTGGPESTAMTLQALGYPLYLMRILGFAKILGAIAILSNKSSRLKEWAYAGFTIDFLGAAASHVLAGDAVHAPIAIVMFAFMMGSYMMWHRTEGAPIYSK